MQIKAIEQHFHVVLFLMRVIFRFVNETPVCQGPITQHFMFHKIEFYSWERRLSRYNCKMSPAGIGMVAVLLVFLLLLLLLLFLCCIVLLLLRKAGYCFRKSKLFPVMFSSHGDKITMNTLK